MSTPTSRRTQPATEVFLTRYILMAALAGALLAGCAHQGPRAAAPLPSPLASMARTARAFSFTTIQVPGARRTSASGINDDGDMVGSYEDSTGVSHGYVLRRGIFTTIDFPGATFTEARGIGGGGEIVGTYRKRGEPPLNFHGYLLTPAGEFVPVDSPGHLNTIAQRILPDGTILGCRHDNDFMASMRGNVIGRRGNSETDAFASMHNGATPDLRRIAGLYNYTTANRIDAYVIDAGVFKPLIVPGSSMTAAWDVNPAGEVVGTYRDSTGFHGFVLTTDGYVLVDVPAATATRAFGINANGAVVGSFVAGERTYGFMAIPTRPPDR